MVFMGHVVAPVPEQSTWCWMTTLQKESDRTETETRFRYVAGKTDLAMLRQRTAFAERFPDLAWETGYQASNLTYVRLASPAVNGVDTDGVKPTRGVR